MDQPSRGFRFSSARRGARRPSTAVVVAVALTALVILLAIILRKPPPQVVVAPLPSPTPPPPPTSTPTATPAAVVELASEWVVASTLEPTPTQWPTAPPPVRREPTPTPGLADCVTYRWTTVQIFNPSAQVLTEITASNNCGRDLGPLELLFEISGWRDGGLVQSVRARPFDRIRRGHTGIISVGLPGSIDWYDKITVEIVE